MMPISGARPAPRRLLLLIPVLAAGIFTILASSVTDDGDDTPPVPVTVQFVIGSRPSPLSRDVGARVATISDLRLAGNYRSDSSQSLTLDRDNLMLDTTTAFDLELVAGDPDDTFEGTSRVELTATMDLGPDRDPTTGQYSSLVTGTTTLVTARSGGVDVAVGGAATQAFSWNDFEALVDDENAALDLRFASSAFNQLRGLLVLALLTETALATVDANATMLEGVGLDVALELACDIPQGGTVAGESALFWRVDSAGAGQGSAGQGDSFEQRFDNCFDIPTARYFEGTLLVSGYVPAQGPVPRAFAANASFSALFLSLTAIDITTVPAADSPRINGELSLDYDEIPDPAT